jgi:hypothetical protein
MWGKGLGFPWGKGKKIDKENGGSYVGGKMPRLT